MKAKQIIFGAYSCCLVDAPSLEGPELLKLSMLQMFILRLRRIPRPPFCSSVAALSERQR
jgi:hypothetical protein